MLLGGDETRHATVDTFLHASEQLCRELVAKLLELGSNQASCAEALSERDGYSISHVRALIVSFPEIACDLAETF